MDHVLDLKIITYYGYQIYQVNQLSIAHTLLVKNNFECLWASWQFHLFIIIIF